MLLQWRRQRHQADEELSRTAAAATGAFEALHEKSHLVALLSGRLIGEHLRPYAAAGWLSYPEVDMLSRMPERRRARHWARFAGGRRALAAHCPRRRQR